MSRVLRWGFWRAAWPRLRCSVRRHKSVDVAARQRTFAAVAAAAAMQSHTGYEFTNYMRAKGEYENQSMKYAAEEMKAKQAAKEKYPLHFACGEGATAEEVASGRDRTRASCNRARLCVWRIGPRFGSKKSLSLLPRNAK